MWRRIADTIERIDQLSTQVKVVIFVLILVIIGVAYWHWFWSPKQQELRSLRVKIQREERVLNEYRLIADELPEFERQYELLARQYEAASMKLPTEKEIPGLIDSIYGAVNESGLEASTFLPKGEVRKDIYAEIPVEMDVFGTYYNIARFFDSVSRLSRIVNINNLNLERPRARTQTSALKASFTAVTFRILPVPVRPPGDQAPDRGRSR